MVPQQQGKTGMYGTYFYESLAFSAEEETNMSIHICKQCPLKFCLYNRGCS